MSFLFSPYSSGGFIRDTAVLPFFLSVFWALILIAASQSVLFPSVLFLAACIGFAIHYSSFSIISSRLLIVVFVSLAVGFLKLLFTAGETLYSVSVFGFLVKISKEGFYQSLLFAMRILGAGSLLVLLGLYVPVHLLFLSLRRLGISPTVLELSSQMYRYIFLLLDSAATMILARKVRLGYTSTWKSVASTGGIAGLIFLRAVDESEKISEARKARGVQDGLNRPELRNFRYVKTEIIYTILGMIALSVLFVFTGGVL